jgi:signal transduction histidine kinase
MNSLTPIRTLTHAIERSLEEIKPSEANTVIIQDIRENSELIAKRSASMADFLKRYREITRIREISKRKLMVADLLQEVIALFQKQFSEQQVRCTLAVEPADLFMEGDENLLKQVIINLVKNALEAMKASTGGLLLMKAAKKENQVILTVEDNGPGIAVEHMEDIFTPFFSTRKDGSGIGLSFSKQIVRLHEGTIAIQSEPAGGTRVIMKFRQGV